MKTLAALIITNLLWAGYAFSYDDKLPMVGHLAAGMDPTDQAMIIRVDERGYAICSNEKPKP